MDQVTIIERISTLRDAVQAQGSQDAYFTFTYDGEEIVMEARVYVVDVERGVLEGSEYGGQEIAVQLADITEIFVG